MNAEYKKTATELRHCAEEILRSEKSVPPEALSLDEANRLIHELAVHRLELEMQNEELRRTQAELAAAEERYFDLYNLAPVGYVTVGEQGMLLDGNLTAADRLGLDPDVLIGLPVTQFILAEDQDIFYLHSKKLFETGEPQDLELRMLDRVGTQFWAHLTMTARRENGCMSRCRIALTDLTGHKQQEEEKARLESQLQQAQKMEAIGRLAGGVAHDFNNMLSIIISYTEMALENMDPALQLHADLEEVLKAANRSADLTRQLLAFARKQLIVPQVLDLNKTVADILDVMRRTIGENIDINFEAGSDLWPVHMDPGQIHQIVTNLCINARDSIADVGSITVETSNRILDKAYCAEHGDSVPGEYVQLAVRDTGCGMDKETVDKLFEPFFTTKELGKGTGLGLATTYGIVRQNSGCIHVCSEPGHGTVFRICLPRYMGEDAAIQAVSMPGPVRGHETILLVEDEQAILKSLKAVLEKQGYEVLDAFSAAEAIRIASDQAGRISLLLTDVVMPEMNGRDLALRLKTLYPHFKCLYMSGHNISITAPDGLLDEDICFIQKPFTMQELAAKVREVLDGS